MEHDDWIICFLARCIFQSQYVGVQMSKCRGRPHLPDNELVTDQDLKPFKILIFISKKGLMSLMYAVVYKDGMAALHSDCVLIDQMCFWVLGE